MRRTVMLLAALGAAAVLVSQAAASPKPSVAVTGTTVKGRVVTVTVRLSNWRLLPRLVGKKPNSAGGGHWHIFVDGKYNSAVAALRGVTTKLTAGSHRIVAELANNDHSRLSPPVRSAAVKVTVTVTSAGAGAGAGAVPPAAGDNGTDTAGAGGAGYGY